MMCTLFKTGGNTRAMDKIFGSPTLYDEEIHEAVKRTKCTSPMDPIHLFFFHALTLVLFLWLMFGAICGFEKAPDNDMSPHIKISDLLLYYRLDKNVKAQDVVVLEKNGTRYVGRIAAACGDTVEITPQETLVINGNTIHESSIYTKTPRYEGFTEYPVTLGESEYFILCDNRSDGEDSRYYGVVEQDEIIGTVITVFRRNNI